MSGASSKSKAAAERVLTPKHWGPITAVILGFFAYKIPEWLVSGLAPVLVPLLPQNDNIRTFILYGLFEALTIGAVFMLVVWFNSTFRHLGLAKFRPYFIFQAVMGYSTYFVLTALVAYAAGQLFAIPDEQQAIGFFRPGGLELALAFLALVVIVPVAEELVFRGFIFKGIRKGHSFVFTSFIVSVLFAVAHGQLNVGIDVFCLSLVLCYLREKTGSLWPGIMVHGLKNAVAFFMIFIYNVR